MNTNHQTHHMMHPSVVLALLAGCQAATLVPGSKSLFEADTGQEDPDDTGQVDDTGDTSDTSVDTGDTGEDCIPDGSSSYFEPRYFSFRAGFGYNSEDDQVEPYWSNTYQQNPFMYVEFSEDSYVAGSGIGVRTCYIHYSWGESVDTSYVTYGRAAGLEDVSGIWFGFIYPVYDAHPDLEVRTTCDGYNWNPAVWGAYMGDQTAMPDLTTALIEHGPIYYYLGELDPEIDSALISLGMRDEEQLGGGFVFNDVIHPGYVSGSSLSEEMVLLYNEQGTALRIESEDVGSDSIPNGVYTINASGSMTSNMWVDVCQLAQ